MTPSAGRILARARIRLEPENHAGESLLRLTQTVFDASPEQCPLCRGAMAGTICEDCGADFDAEAERLDSIY